MDLKQLLYFVTVTDEGNITAAAKKLYMTQPPLSTQLKLLEQEMGCILLERGARRVKLTQAGEVLYKYARTMLDISRVAKEEVSSVSTENAGTIRIGIVSSLVCSYAAELICKYMQENTNTDFEISEGNTYQLIEMLKSGTIHMAIIRTPFSDDNLNQYVISEDTLTAVGHKSFFTSDTAELSKLAKSPLIIYRRWEHIIRKMFEENGIVPKWHIVCDDARTAVHFASKEAGIALVPQSATPTYYKDIISVHIEKCSIKSKIVLATTDNQIISKCADKFISFINK